jgi:hypothetical protein
MQTTPSSRTSSLGAYEPHGTEQRTGAAAGAPWSPVSNVAGLSKQQQQQQQQVGGMHGLVQ